MENLINEISDLTKKEKNLMYRSFSELCSCYVKEELIVHYIGNNMAGFVLCKSLDKHTVELGALYVKPEYRSNGIGTYLLEKAMENGRDKNILVRTKEKKVKSFLEYNGFKPVKLKTDWQLASLYIKDRMLSPYKFIKFLKSVNSGSCAYVRACNM